MSSTFERVSLQVNDLIGMRSWSSLTFPQPPAPENKPLRLTDGAELSSLFLQRTRAKPYSLYACIAAILFLGLFQDDLYEAALTASQALFCNCVNRRAGRRPRIPSAVSRDSGNT